MDKDKDTIAPNQINDLEMVQWVEEEESMRGLGRAKSKRVEELYETFQELYDALMEYGPLVVTSLVVDVVLIAVEGHFDGHIMAVRHSGRNVRRFLIRADSFELEYGTVQNCLDHIRSNNAVDCELELHHLFALAEHYQVSADTIDPQREYGRLEIDLIAALQLIKIIDESEGGEGTYSDDFELGYCVGRLFSCIQNLASLEPDARKSYEYEQSYKERGKKGKSRDRREARQEHLFSCIEHLVLENPAFSRLRPLEVAKIACQDAKSQNPDLWTQGSGQLEQYLTWFASDPKYSKAYRDLFPNTG